MPSPSQGESEQDFVGRCIPIVIEEGTAKDNEQAAAICHSMYGQNKKLAGCYSTAEECIADQMKLGKPMEDAKEIALYISGKGKLAEKNLIIVRPDMDFGVLPKKQVVFYSVLLKKWESRGVKDYSKEQVSMMLSKISEEIKKRGLDGKQHGSAKKTVN